MQQLKAHLGKYGIWYALAALALGIYVGTQWEKWFPSNGATQRATAACYKCCTTSGISCPGCDCTTNSPKR